MAGLAPGGSLFLEVSLRATMGSPRAAPENWVPFHFLISKLIIGAFWQQTSISTGKNRAQSLLENTITLFYFFFFHFYSPPAGHSGRFVIGDSGWIKGGHKPALILPVPHHILQQKIIDSLVNCSFRSTLWAEMKFFDIKLSKDLIVLLHAVHSPFYHGGF